MNDDMIAEAVDSAVALLDTDERVWIVGLARLLDVPWDRALTTQEFDGILHAATTSVSFPCGPVAYSPGGMQREINPLYVSATLSAPADPHLRMRIGCGSAGFVSTALTRSGHLADDLDDPHGVLLTDVESIIGDTFTLALAMAFHLDYQGPVGLAFLIAPHGPGADPQFYALDPRSGRIVPTGKGGAFAPLRHTFELTADVTPKTILAEVRGQAERLAPIFGVPGAQLMDIEPENIAERRGDLRDAVDRARTVE